MNFSVLLSWFLSFSSLLSWFLSFSWVLFWFFSFSSLLSWFFIFLPLLSWFLSFSSLFFGFLNFSSLLSWFLNFLSLLFCFSDFSTLFFSLLCFSELFSLFFANFQRSMHHGRRKNYCCWWKCKSEKPIIGNQVWWRKRTRSERISSRGLRYHKVRPPHWRFCCLFSFLVSCSAFPCLCFVFFSIVLCVLDQLRIIGFSYFSELFNIHLFTFGKFLQSAWMWNLVTFIHFYDIFLHSLPFFKVFSALSFLFSFIVFMHWYFFGSGPPTLK